MAKKPTQKTRAPSKLSLQQLKHRTWPTRDKALVDLRRSGVPESGADYQLGEHQPGFWMLLDRADMVDDAPTRPAEPELHTPEFEPEKEVVSETPPSSEIDWRVPLPHTGKPYTIALREGVAYPAHSTHTWAMEIARDRKAPVDVLDKDGNLIGTLDPSKYPAREARSKGDGTRKGGNRQPRDPNAGPNEMMQKAIALAVRREGVTRAQLKDISPKSHPWTMMLKACDRWGYEYSTTEAPEGSSSRTVYHLKKT